MYETALNYADLQGNEVVWDLYCGIGTISLFLAKQAKQVYGVEIIPQAIQDAKENAVRNNITNAEFIDDGQTIICRIPFDSNGVKFVTNSYTEQILSNILFSRYGLERKIVVESMADIEKYC